MKNFEDFLNESTGPKNINVSNLSKQMRDDASQKWLDKLKELFVDKYIYFKGSEWNIKHSWNYYFIKVKSIYGVTNFLGPEFDIEDYNGKIYTVLSSEIIKVYDTEEDYMIDYNTKKYNI